MGDEPVDYLIDLDAQTLELICSATIRIDIADHLLEPWPMEDVWC